MLNDDDYAELRSLVVDDEAPRSSLASRWQLWLIVGSVVVAIAALLMLRAGTPPQAADTETEVRPPDVPVTTFDPFDELRFLPADLPSTLRITSIDRFDAAQGLALYVRHDENGAIDAAVYIDRVDSIFFAGLDGTGPTPISAGPHAGWVSENGSYETSTAGWRDPELGEMRAWATGLGVDGLTSLVETIVPDLPDRPDADGWAKSDTFVGTAGGRVIRSHYLDGDGNAAVVTATESAVDDGVASIDTSGCDVGERIVCSDLIAWRDEGVEIVVTGEPGFRLFIADQLRAVGNRNAQIVDNEATPWAAARLDDFGDQRVLAPADDSVWSVEAAAAHWSGTLIDEPAVVLLERTRAQVGRVTGGVVIDLLEDGESVLDARTLDRAALVSEVKVGDGRAQLIGWNHSDEDLAAIAEVLDYSSVEGFSFARQGLESSRGGKGYEVDHLVGHPEALSEGMVVTARLSSDDGESATLRVSRSPQFSAASMMLEPHINSDLVVEAQGRAVGVQVRADGGVILRWQHEPGVLATLRGDDVDALVALAEELTWTSGTDHRAAFESVLNGDVQPPALALPAVVGPTAALDVEIEGGGEVHRSPDLEHYPIGSTVRLFAVPGQELAFDGWVVDGQAVTGSVIDVEVEADTRVQASFVALPEPAPGIEFWYGESQRFARQAQRWVNIHGTATDPQGIASATFSLNGAPPNVLSIGPDERRNEEPGDFNVEIDRDDLREGSNIVVVTVTDLLGGVMSASVEVIWDPQPAPISGVDWSTVDRLTDAVQVIDGRWHIDGDVVRTTRVGYDRLLGIGDDGWIDYEAQVPITIHSLGPRSGARLSGNALVGFILNWVGHSEGRSASQPYWEFWPTGAFASYRLDRGGTLVLLGNENDPVLQRPMRLEYGTTYVFKVRVEAVIGGVAYSFKVWEADRLEPADWTSEIVVDDGPETGSLLLVAHHFDATFGELVVKPLS